MDVGRGIDPDFVLHTGLADVLPDEHPHAWETISCDACQVMVHAFNNECMTPWVESPDNTRRWCLECFTANADDYETIVATEQNTARKREEAPRL
jgi:hypothetical protein